MFKNEFVALQGNEQSCCGRRELLVELELQDGKNHAHSKQVCPALRFCNQSYACASCVFKKMLKKLDAEAVDFGILTQLARNNEILDGFKSRQRVGTRFFSPVQNFELSNGVSSKVFDLCNGS